MLPIDVLHEHGTLPFARIPRKRRLNTEQMLFLLFDVFNGSNEGVQGVVRLGREHGISPGSVSNYFRHALMSLFISIVLNQNSWSGLTRKRERSVI